jgi:polysaccharide export outer membrane protein
MSFVPLGLGPQYALRWSGVALAVALLLMNGAGNAPAQSQTSNAVQSYRVGPNDQLQITVFGQDKLSGKFRVGSDGAISFPLIGNVGVINLTTDEIGKKLETSLATRMPAGLSPSVEIFEYAPVFIVGDVEKPGPYQYRPGMIALELTALGGGSTKGRDLDVLQMANQEQELADQRILRYSQQAQRARLIAELAGNSNSDFRVPSSGDDELVSADARRRIVSDQISLFKVHQNIIADQTRALGDQRASYDQEMASLRDSIVLHDQEVKLLEQQVATEESLAGKGLAITSKVLDIKRVLSATKRNALDLRLALARARQRQLEIDEKVVELRDVQSKDDAKELSEVDVLMARTEEKIAAVQNSIGRLRDVKTRRLRTIESIFTVVRSDGDKHVEIPIKAFDVLQPRDILRVERPDLSFGPTEASN